MDLTVAAVQHTLFILNTLIVAAAVVVAAVVAAAAAAVAVAIKSEQNSQPICRAGEDFVYGLMLHLFFTVASPA